MDNVIKIGDAEKGKSELLCRRIAESNLIGVGFGDSKGNIFYVNDEMLRMMGYCREDYEAGRVNWRDCVAPEYQDEINQTTGILYKEGIHKFYQREFLRPDGGRTPYMGAAVLTEPSKDVNLSIAVDLTDIKSTQKKLEDAQNQYSAMLSVQPAAIYTCDSKGVITYYNQKAAELWGYKPKTGSDESRFCGSYRLYTPDGEFLPHDKTPMAQCIRRGESFRNLEVIVERPDGTRVYVMVNISPLRDSEGHIIGAINSFIDITEKKKYQDSIEAQKKLLDAIIDNIPVMLCIWDPELENFKFNKEIEKVLGWNEKDVASGDFMEKVYPDPKQREFVVSYMQSLKKGWHDFKMTAKDGSVIDSSWANVLLPDGRCIGIGIDNRERKESEVKLRESEQRFRAMADGLPLIVWVFDENGTFEFFNKTFYDFFGLGKDEVDSKTWQRYVHPDDADRYFGEFRKCLEERTPFHSEVRCRRFDGQWRWFESWGQARYSEHGEYTGIVGACSDVTERKAGEQELRALNEELEERVAMRIEQVEQQSSQLRGLALQLSRAEQTERRRLASILHDNIQQLIVGARMQAQLIRQYKDPEKIEKAIDSLKDILREALDESRSLAVDLSPPILQEGGLIGALKWFAAQVHKKNLFTVELKLDINAEPALEETRLLIFDCAKELILNSVKHSGISKLNLTLLRREGGIIKLIVSDHGKGFDPEKLKDRKSEELTFGLFSIQQRLAHIGADMEIVSEPDKGTKIILSIFDQGMTDKPGGQKGPYIKKARSSNTNIRTKSGLCTVLICDDHKIVRDGINHLLQVEPDIKVVGQAEDGIGVVEMAEELRPDIIIMDVGLGEVSGIEATRRILARNRHMKILGLSMYDDEAIENAMRRAGACAYVSKNAPSEHLIETIRKTCGLATKSRISREALQPE